MRKNWRWSYCRIDRGINEQFRIIAQSLARGFRVSLLCSQLKTTSWCDLGRTKWGLWRRITLSIQLTTSLQWCPLQLVIYWCTQWTVSTPYQWLSIPCLLRQQIPHFFSTPLTLCPFDENHDGSLTHIAVDEISDSSAMVHKMKRFHKYYVRI